MDWRPFPPLLLHDWGGVGGGGGGVWLRKPIEKSGGINRGILKGLDLRRGGRLWGASAGRFIGLTRGMD
jgi:hypothetical protein